MGILPSAVNTGVRQRPCCGIACQLSPKATTDTRSELKPALQTPHHLLTIQRTLTLSSTKTLPENYDTPTDYRQQLFITRMITLPTSPLTHWLNVSKGQDTVHILLANSNTWEDKRLTSSDNIFRKHFIRLSISIFAVLATTVVLTNKYDFSHYCIITSQLPFCVSVLKYMSRCIIIVVLPTVTANTQQKSWRATFL